jgi:hypothetical protein
MSNKEAGKGKRPRMGYNAKNWNENFDNIKWHKSRVRYATNGTNQLSGAHFPHPKTKII